MTSNFPKFTGIRLEDKDSYDKFISNYPPYSDILFPTLQIWWNIEGELSTSYLNKNLVIHYSQSFDHENAGYCLVGKSSVDKSIETIFSYLRKEHKTIRLVHVPEFVIKEIEHIDDFEIIEELDYNEYIIDCKGMAKLDTPEYGRIRRGVNRFLREVGDKKIEIINLNLSSPSKNKQLLDAINDWGETSHGKNDPLGMEKQAIKRTLKLESHLNIKNFAIYIDGEMHGLVLYHRPMGGSYYVGHHLKVNYKFSYIFDYMIHQLAIKGVNDGISYINCEMDLGIESLRSHKMKLRPVDFFRKYTILPKS
jgi:hypothetical protein